ncbi:MAG: bifunctional AP-4-A phosphorylase/ADP sulfurylase [Chrysothrix sp. TS-e1954]|nr:MAG: bifunctional AP-4-A phosphorylase/ADP sulfurylase [Chrysothrix sp. TS-e1954]
MSLKLSASLASLVRSRYQSATSCEAVTLTATELAVVRIAGVPFQLRYCPTLAKKPTPQHEVASSPPKKKFDPFVDPPKDLFIAEVPSNVPSHVLVLNKYPIIPNHFILATKTNKQQTHQLEEDDIGLTYECLKAWETQQKGEDDPGRLFAFFNSGEHSGASQPHRHVQFLPEEDMRSGLASGEWSLLADQLVSADVPEFEISTTAQLKLPFVAFGARFSPSSATSNNLHQLYVQLYDAALQSVHRYIAAHHESMRLHPSNGGDMSISYNLAMTTTCMVICPRRSEGSMITRDDGSELDFVALNGTVLGGTLMVKNEELWQLLKRHPLRLEKVLEACGVPRGNKEATIESS